MPKRLLDSDYWSFSLNKKLNSKKPILKSQADVACSLNKSKNPPRYALKDLPILAGKIILKG